MNISLIMSRQELEITPDVIVHKLLLVYPELEEVLIGIAPAFKRLKNPVLRRTVAKIATLRQASSVSGVPLNHLIAVLRAEVGQEASDKKYEDVNYFTEQPIWFDCNKIKLSIDVERRDNQNEMPLGSILWGGKSLKKGEIIELKTTFVPAPIIDVMRTKGYDTWSSNVEGVVYTYFKKAKVLIGAKT